MTHCPPGHYDTSLGPIFLKIDRQTHCETGNTFLTSKVDIDAKLINYSWLMTHCQPGHYAASLGPIFLKVTKENLPRYKLQFSKVTQCHVVKPIKEVTEKKYLEDLRSNLLHSVTTGKCFTLPKVPVIDSNSDKT